MMLRTTALAAALMLPTMLIAQAQETGPPDPVPPAEEAEQSTTDRAVEATRDGLGEAAMRPLEDLNLRRKTIPANLRNLQSPYHVPRGMDCAAIASLISDLDTSLGADWDTKAPEPETTRSEKVADVTSAATLNQVASQASGLIPFRGVVRSVSGANSFANRRDRAYALGAQQRAYLKGMGMAQGCEAPAAPAEHVVTSRIVFRGDNPSGQ